MSVRGRGGGGVKARAREGRQLGCAGADAGAGSHNRGGVATSHAHFVFADPLQGGLSQDPAEAAGRREQWGWGLVENWPRMSRISPARINTTDPNGTHMRCS
jgi:hypothetical protein